MSVITRPLHPEITKIFHITIKMLVPPLPPQPITSSQPAKNYGNSFFSRLFFAEKILYCHSG